MSEVVEMCSNLALIDVYAPLSTEIHTCYVDKFNFRVFLAILLLIKTGFMPLDPLKRAWTPVTLFQDLPGPSVCQLFLYQLCTIILNSPTLGGADALVSKQHVRFTPSLDQEVVSGE